MDFTIEQADYHRNGVGGEGFYVGIANCEVDGENQRMLITFFPHETDEGEACPAGKDKAGEYANARVAVVSLDALPAAGVTFGQNSWRGDNFYKVADAIVKQVRDR